MTFETPILFLIFNRPETTQIVFNIIKNIKPKHLYIAADGPRNLHPKDSDLCKNTRDLIINQIDWGCEVKTLFRDENLGCRKAVSEGITWFFNNVEKGIILEDDVLPDISFFSFCEELLIYYKNDKRIFQISGCNYNLPNISNKYSYFFSKYISIWGWATWKDRWEQYKISEEVYKEILYTENETLIFAYNTPDELKIRIDQFKSTFLGNIDTWDYIWSFTNIIQNGLTCIPHVNLVKNIGFSSNATHTKDSSHKYSKLHTSKINPPIKHPPYILKSYTYEKNYFQQTNIQEADESLKLILKKICKLIKNKLK